MALIRRKSPSVVTTMVHTSTTAHGLQILTYNNHPARRRFPCAHRPPFHPQSHSPGRPISLHTPYTHFHHHPLPPMACHPLLGQGDVAPSATAAAPLVVVSRAYTPSEHTVRQAAYSRSKAVDCGTDRCLGMVAKRTVGASRGWWRVLVGGCTR